MSRVPALLIAALLLTGCATENMRSKQTVLDETLRSYAATIRWGDIGQAQAFIKPDLREKQAPSALELARYEQVRITGYDEMQVQPIDESEVRQTVRIDLVNVNTQAARSLVDRQTWRYDEETKRWWLVSGLPDISRRD